MEWPRDVETWVVWLTYAPLMAASVVGFALTMAKFVAFRRRTLPSDDVRERLWRLLEKRDLEKALLVAEAESSRATHLVSVLLRQRDRSSDQLKDRAAHVGGVLAREMETGLDALALVATLGPLFGLFGTVVGITIVFNHLSAGDAAAGPQQLAGGIGTALYTTILGLIIGVLGLVFHSYFTARLERHVAELEDVALDVVERLTEHPR